MTHFLWVSGRLGFKVSTFKGVLLDPLKHY